MLSFSRASQERLLAIVAPGTGSDGFMNDAHAFAAYDDEVLRSCAVFQNITTRGAELHFWADGPLTRDMLTGFYAYAFGVKGYRCLRAPIAAWNTRAIVTALKSGFQIAGIIGGGAIDGSDAIILTMTKDQCRWFRPQAPASAQTETAA